MQFYFFSPVFAVLPAYICLGLFFSGTMKIAEVASRFSSVKAFVSAVRKIGFDLKEKVLRYYFAL